MPLGAGAKLPILDAGGVSAATTALLSCTHSISSKVCEAIGDDEHDGSEKKLYSIVLHAMEVGGQCVHGLQKAQYRGILWQSASEDGLAHSL